MSADTQTSPRTPRLNPFAFPSDTTFRFVLLIVSVVGASLFAYNWLFMGFFDEEIEQVYKQCQEEAAQAYPIDDPSALADPMANPDQPLAQLEANNQCTQPWRYAQFAWATGGAALLLIVTGAFYWTAPTLKIRREGHEPLSEEDSPEMVAYLADLCREAGLSRPPTFLLNPHNHGSSGLAFGRLGRYYVVLNVGLVTQFYTDRPAFRAIVLHELAHLRNADVNKTYFALAVWWAFLIAALLPYTVSLVYILIRDGDLGAFFGAVWRVLALTALVYLTRSAVLRAREVYADVRASVWDGPSGALGRVLAALPRSEEESWQAILKEARWRDMLKEIRRWAMLQVHPDPDERRRALTETSALFRMGFWEAFGTGVAGAIAFPNVAFLLQLVTAPGQSPLVPTVAALLFAPLMVGVVGLGVWRSAFAAMARCEAPPGVGYLGLGLGLGIIVGRFISLYSAVGSTDETSGTAGFSFYVLWGALLLISMFFFLRWIAAGASAWLEVTVTRRSLRLTYVLGLTIAGVLLVWWLGMLFLQLDTAGAGFDAQIPDGPLAVIYNTITVISYGSTVGLYSPIAGLSLTAFILISLWAFPLAIWLWDERATAVSESNWAFLDPSPRPFPLPPQPPLRPVLALMIGLIGGLLFCGLLAVIRIGLHLSLPESVRSTDEFALWFTVGQFTLAVLIQLVVAASGAALPRRLGWAHGLFAAFVAACIMAVGTIGLNELAGCVEIFSFVSGSSCLGGINWVSASQTTFLPVVFWGTLFSLPVAVGVSAIRGIKPRTEENQNFGAPTRVRVLGAVAGTIAALAIVTPAFGMEMKSLTEQKTPDSLSQDAPISQQNLPLQQNDPLQEGNGGVTPAPVNGETPANLPSSSPTTEPTTQQQIGTTQRTEASPAPSQQTPSAVPSGYVLDPRCEKASGSTGLDIYYTQPTSDSLRFACVHRSDKSPYINFDGQFDKNLAEVGGPYCAFSKVDKNVGCALSPITEGDLMNVPPAQGKGVPAGYVLEDCQQGVGATGKTIYYRPPLPPEPGGRQHTYWFECVHREGANPIVNVLDSPSGSGKIVGDGGGPYCIFSARDKNIGCALEPITGKDLMNPS